MAASLRFPQLLIKLYIQMKKIDFTDISRLDFNLAVTFLAIWQEGSVSRAAQSLSLSQSAVSAALLRLRETTGDALFIRTRGGMQPTAFARAIAPDLASALSQLQGAFHRASQDDPAGSQRQFVLGMSDDFHIAVGPALQRAVARIAPRVRLVFRQTNRHRVDGALESGEIDIGVVAHPPRRPWMERQDIARSDYACLHDPESCPLPDPFALAPYLALPHVLVSFSGREGIVDEKLRQLGQDRQILCALTHFASLPPFLLGQRAIATIPRHAARALAAFSKLRVAPCPLALEDYPVSLVWTKENDTPWLRSCLADTLREVLGTPGAATVEAP